MKTIPPIIAPQRGPLNLSGMPLKGLNPDIDLEVGIRDLTANKSKRTKNK